MSPACHRTTFHGRSGVEGWSPSRSARGSVVAVWAADRERLRPRPVHQDPCASSRRAACRSPTSTSSESDAVSSLMTRSSAPKQCVQDLVELPLRSHFCSGSAVRLSRRHPRATGQTPWVAVLVDAWLCLVPVVVGSPVSIGTRTTRTTSCSGPGPCLRSHDPCHWSPVARSPSGEDGEERDVAGGLLYSVAWSASCVVVVSRWRSRRARAQSRRGTYRGGVPRPRGSEEARWQDAARIRRPPR